MAHTATCINGADMDKLNEAARERKLRRARGQIRISGNPDRLPAKEDWEKFSYKENHKWHEGVK